MLSIGGTLAALPGNCLLESKQHVATQTFEPNLQANCDSGQHGGCKALHRPAPIAFKYLLCHKMSTGKLMSLQGTHPAKGALTQQPRLAVFVEHKGHVRLMQPPALWSPVLGKPLA